MLSRPRNVLVMGAAGRDFHNFNLFFRGNPHYLVKAFTACQIPGIANRIYPKVLAGDLYPNGIPIYPENELASLIEREKIDDVVFAYSDVPNAYVMSRSALVNGAGADFILLGTRSTMLKSTKPVISVCAVRTGCGKSQTTRAIAELLAERKMRAAVIRHPMPYGDLATQISQRFESLSDLEKYHCTIEEREEYELHIEKGHLLFAGVDYGQILKEAERECDVILWDGGNNDLPFYKPDLHIVLMDPHRPGNELSYYPSQANFQMADVLMIAKIGTATEEGIQQVRDTIQAYHPKARVLEADSVVQVSHPALVRGKRVLVVEDGPTLTHGGMAYGAGYVAAKKYGAGEIVDPRPFAVGSIQETFRSFPHLHNVLPAMGYSAAQIQDLESTLAATPCDAVLVGTPFNLQTVLKRSPHPLVRVTYDLDEKTYGELGHIVDKFLQAKTQTTNH